METIRTATRIHPLMAAAAVSVVIVSLVGAAAITGILPSSHGETAPNAASLQPAAPLAALPAPAAAPVAAPASARYVEPVQLAQEEAPAPKHTIHHAKAVHHHSTQVARNDGDYAQRPAPQPAAQHQPNYLAIGAGALVGGVLGHQVGGGNGKKLATVAGAIGGGFLGNEMANRSGK